jgi:5-methyltetrahydropteroyltriglutamate--homocysteine methyltransferase
MFATLVGAYPRTPLPRRPFRLRAAYGQLERDEIDQAGFRAIQDELVREVVAEQIDAGLGLLTDGQVRWEDAQTPIARGLDGFDITGLLRYFDTNTYYRQPRAIGEPRWRGPITVDDWRFADSAAADAARERRTKKLPVKAAIVGPYTLARLSDPGELDRERLTLALAEALREEVRALLEAGAPVVQVDDNALTLIGRNDDDERKLAAEALRRLSDGVEGHLTLAVTMGSAEAAGPRLFFDLPFASYLFDLIAGPDNWRVIAHAPTDRGIVVGVADARNTRRDDESVMIWAARYASAINDRGLDRVGLAPSTGLEYLPRDRAKQKIEALGRAAATAAIRDPEALKESLDPRAVDARTAALGRYVPAGAGVAGGRNESEEESL